MKKEFTLPEKEYRKKQIAFYNELNKGSHKITFTPCKGTVVNAGFDEDKKQIQKQINYKASFKAPKAISSTKIGNDRTQKHKTVRAGRYQPQMLTVVLLMKMTKKQREGLEINRYYAFRPK